jgi:hypothetical protein
MPKTVRFAAVDNADGSIVQFGANKDTKRNICPPPEPPPESTHEVELDVCPPPEPPPESTRELDLHHILESLQPNDRDAFAAQFIKDKISQLGITPCGVPSFPNDQKATCLYIPPGRPPARPSPKPRALVEYCIPLDKARPPNAPYFPQGLMLNPSILIHPASPTTPFEFPFDMPQHLPMPSLDSDFQPFAPLDSVMRVVGLPRV